MTDRNKEQELVYKAGNDLYQAIPDATSVTVVVDLPESVIVTGGGDGTRDSRAQAVSAVKHALALMLYDTVHPGDLKDIALTAARSLVDEVFEMAEAEVERPSNVH